MPWLTILDRTLHLVDGGAVPSAAAFVRFFGGTHVRQAAMLSPGAGRFLAFRYNPAYPASPDASLVLTAAGVSFLGPVWIGATAQSSGAPREPLRWEEVRAVDSSGTGRRTFRSSRSSGCPAWCSRPDRRPASTSTSDARVRTAAGRRSGRPPRRGVRQR